MPKKIFLFIGINALIGCSVFENSSDRNRLSAGISRQQLYIAKDDSGRILPTLFWSHYDATQRGGLYLVNSNGTVKVISENPPDAALNSTIDLLAKAKVDDKVDAAAKFSAIKTMAELGKRNAANYMIRDLAFRIESLQNNATTIDSNIIKTYHKLIQSAEAISVAEAQTAKYSYRTESLKELTQLIRMSKDTMYKDLKLDSTLIRTITEYIEKE